ncbi:HdeD family acid-resistance protein [Frateuria aurantia]
MKTLFRPSGRGWGWMVLRGLVLVLFGWLAAFSPFSTALGLAWVLGLYACIDGVLLLMASTAHGATRRPLLWAGVFGLLLGLVSLIWPQITVVLVLSVIGVWVLLAGILQCVAAWQLPPATPGRAWLGLGGLLSLLFGLLLLARPAGALATLMTIFGIWAVIVGVLTLLHGWQLRRQGPAF